MKGNGQAKLRAPVRMLVAIVAIPFTLIVSLSLVSLYWGDAGVVLDPLLLLAAVVAFGAWYLVITGRVPGFITRDAKYNAGDFKPEPQMPKELYPEVTDSEVVDSKVADSEDIDLRL